jgi:hypothetical protein
LVIRGRACGNGEKAEAFCARLFQADVEIIKKVLPEGHLDRFPYLRQFPQAFPFWVSFVLLGFLFLRRSGAFSQKMSCQDRL